MMRTFMTALCVTAIYLIVSHISPANADSCVETALRETKAALGNQARLGDLFDQYFGEDLAKFPVRRTWSTMSTTEQQNQIDYVRGVVVSLSSKFSRYAGAKFSWQGNSARVTLGKKTTTLTVNMAGNGCRMRNLCVKDSGCLSNYIVDVRTLAKRS